MAIVPFLPLQLPWLFDALCGQNWPAGDEDALRRCAQYWDDALKSVADLAGQGNDTSLGVLATVAAMSADEFGQYWSQYTGGDVNDSALGQLAAQCQAMVAALDGQANEVEYTKLTIDITIVLTAIQILFAIAASAFSLGSSLTEIPLAVFIGKQSVLMLAGRFVQMVLMMVIPDLIAQGWMLEVDHTEASWDGSKTGAALENAVAGAVIGTLLGAGAAKLPFMGEEFGKTIGGKLVQGLGHFVEGGLTMDATTLATAGVNYAWADAHGDKQTMAAIQQQLSGAALLRQFASGGLLAAAFYLPHLASPGGSPLTFSAEDGNAYTALLDDQALEHLQRSGTLPDGYTAKVYGQNGVRAGTATFNGADVSIDRPLSDPLSADLTSGPGGQGGFQVTTHDGGTQRWGYPPSGTDPHPTVDGSVVSGDPGQPDPLTVPADQPRAQLLTYSKASDGNVPMPTLNGVPGSPENVRPGSVVHYAAGDGPESARIYRIDFIDAKSGTVTVAQAERPGDTLQLTGTIQYESGPAGTGKLLGFQGATYTAHNYADDGIKSAQVASSSLLTGKMTFGDPDLGRAPEQAAHLYQNAFGDHYDPLASTTPAGASGFQPAGHEASGAGGGFGPDGQGPVALLDGPPSGHATSHDTEQPAVVEADAIVTGSTMASLAANQAGDPVSGGDWAALGEQGEQGKPPVYGQPDTAARHEGQAAADRKIEYHERFDRNPSPAGDEVKNSRSKYQEARSGLENEYLKKVSDLEGKPATSPEEGAALAAAREKAFDEYKGKLTNLAGSHTRQEEDLLEKGTTAAAQQEAELKAVSARIRDINSRKLTAEPAELKELDELRARIQEIRSSNPDGGKANQQAYQLERDRVATLYHEDVSSNLAAREKDLEDRHKSDLSQAYEHEEYRLTNEVSEKQAAARQAAASKADNSEELAAEAAKLRNGAPGKIAELSSRYYELQRGEAARSLRDSLLAEKAAIDDAASSASDPAFQLLLAKLDAIHVTPPADPAAERAAVMQAHEEYARALGSARLEAIDQRLSELGTQDSPEAQYLRRMRAEAAEARDADVPVPGQSSPTSPPGPSAIRRTLADFRDSTPRAQAIDQAVGAVRDKLLNLSRSKVGAAGSLLVDGLHAEEFDVGDAGGEVPGPGTHLWTADGAVIEDRQQRYQAPGDRVVGSHPDRSTDAEAKLLSGIEARLQELREAGTEPTGALVIGSNKLICPSCQARLQEIGGKFPGIQVVVATDTESVVFDSYEAERNPAWVWGTRDVGQLKHVDVGMASSEAASSIRSPTEQVPLADVRRVEHDPALDLSAALDPHGSPRQFETLARAIRQRAVDLQRVQAIIQDASGDLHWVEGGSKGMLSPGLAGMDMGAAGEAGATGGRILLRTSDHMIDITDPAAASSLSPQEHWDHTVILPPEGNPVQLDWSARMDTLRSGVFLRPHDSPIDSRLTGPNLDAVTRVAGQEIVAAHGSEHGISIGGGEEITPEQAAAVLPQVKATTIWNALICDFGTDGKAAALADATGATVRAADTTVFVNKAGQYVAKAPDEATGQPPAGPWKDYSPGGHETPSEIISPLDPSRGDWASLGGHEQPTPPNGHGDPPVQGAALPDGLATHAAGSQEEPLLLAAPSPDVLRLDDRVIQGLPKGVLAYHDEVVVLEEHADASGTYYQVAGDATMYHTAEDAMLSRLHGFANELRSLARAEGVPDELKARFREEAMAREHAAQRMRNAFENARRAAARAVEEEAKGPARAANAIKFRDREARYYQDATREYKAATTHEAAAEAMARQAPIPSRDERESLPPAATALHVGDQVIVVTSARGEGDVRPALHPVVEELYEQARFELTSRIAGLDEQLATVTGAGQRQQLEELRAQLSDQLLQNGRCAEATGLSEWAKQLDQQLQQSDLSLTPTRRNQLILDALKQAHAESVAVDIRYGSGGSAAHGNPKEACANCAVVFKNAEITDLATQHAPDAPPYGAALQFDPSHFGQHGLTASDLAALFADQLNNEPPRVLESWTLTGIDHVTGEAVNRADLPAQAALTPNEWTAALTAMVERIGTNPGLEYGLLSRPGPDGTTTLILAEGGPTQVRPLDGTTLLAHSHPWFGSDRPSFGDFLQLRRKPFEFEYLIAPDGNGHEALVRFSRDGSWTRIATFEDGQWHLGEGHTIQGAAREGTFEAAREQRQEMRARATRLASARSSADLLATDPTLSPAERQEALAEVGRGLAELTGPAGQPSPFLPPELEQVRARLAAVDLTPAEVAVARDHLAAHEAVAKAEAVAAARQARLTVPGLVARAEDAGAYLNRLWLNDRRQGLIANAIGEDKNAQGSGTTARIDFNHQALVNDIYAAVRDAIRDLPDSPGLNELITRVVQGLGADPKAFSDALAVLRDNGIKGLGHAGLTEAQRVLVADTLDLVTTWQETLHDVAAGKHVPDAPRRDLTLPFPGTASQGGTALAGLPADAGQPRDVLRFPDRITPGELARSMPEFRDQQYQARTDLTLLQQAMDRVSGELDQATLDAASGIPGADTRVTALRQELDQLSQHEQALRQDLSEFTKKLWATRNRFGLHADPRDMEPTDPALHHVRDVQRLYSRDHGLPGRAWMGRPPLVPGPELLHGALEVGRAEIPFMERVKRLVSLSGALEEAVRNGEVTPLLPDVVKQQFDAVRAAPRPPDADPALLAARISVLRERVQQLAAYKRLDAPLQSYVDRLIDEAHHEAQQVLPVPHEGTRLPAQAGHASGDSWLDNAKHAAGHPLNATTRNIEGDLVFRLLRTPDGGFYAQFSKVIDLYKIEENQFGAARLTLLDQSLLEHPLTRLGPVDLGVVAGVSMKYALTHGVEFSQSLDRGDAIAIKLWGPGKRVIATSWDRMPTDRQGQPLITTDVRPVNKHTIKTDLAVSPALFVPGAKAMELPAEAKLSLEVSAGPRRGGGVEWKVQGTVEFVAQSPDFRKAGISAAMDWLKGLGYPGWAPSPESSTEATLVLGPIEFHKLPQAVRQQIANHFASRDITITEEGTIPEDQVRQLTGVPVPPLLLDQAASQAPNAPVDPGASAVPSTPRQQPSAIFSALNPPLAARPAAGGQVLPLGPAPSADDRRVLPFGPAPSADDPRLLPFGPAPSADDRRVLGGEHSDVEEDG